MSDPTEMKYPNTQDGVLAMLADIFEYDLEGAVCYPDPSVRSVWKVILSDGTTVTAHLAGYQDATGQIQPFNDAEDNAGT